MLRPVRSTAHSLLERLLAVLLLAYRHFVEPSITRAWGRVSLRGVGKVGADVRIHGRITIIAPDRLSLGDHVRIGSDCFLFCLGGLEIGTNTQISRRVTIYTGNHNYRGEAIPYDDTYVLRRVVIGQSVWIGMGACVLPGVRIGDGAIIGMGTVVSRDVAEGAVVVGSAARNVGQREMDDFRRLERDRRLFARLWPEH